MATLKDLDDLLTRLAQASEGLSLEEFKRQILGEVQREFRGQRINVPDVRVSKKDEIIEAAKRLPSDVVSVRHGVSRQYVNRLIRLRRGGGDG